MPKLTIDQKLETKLATGLVCFQFRKKSDNSIRYAAGTTDPSLIPAGAATITNKVGNKNLTFYDFLKQGIRSLQRDSLIRINATVIK